VSRAALRQEISKIASRYEIFQCVECAQAIKAFLMQEGIAAKRVRLFTGSVEDPLCNIYHEELRRNISTNGRHEGISVDFEGEEIIFDNLHPQGISRDEWLSYLYCPIQDMGGDFQIVELEF
jgi:hypothetical protein